MTPANRMTAVNGLYGFWRGNQNDAMAFNFFDFYVYTSQFNPPPIDSLSDIASPLLGSHQVY